MKTIKGISLLATIAGGCGMFFNIWFFILYICGFATMCYISDNEKPTEIQH